MAARQTKEQQYDLIRRSQSGDLLATEELIEGNIGLITGQATRYLGFCNHLEFADLVQEGKIGMMRAIEKFDLAKGFAFSTYATHWVRQCIQRAISNQDREIYLPSWKTEGRLRPKKEDASNTYPVVIGSLDDIFSIDGLRGGARDWSVPFLELMAAPDNTEEAVIGYIGSDAGTYYDFTLYIARLREVDRTILTQRFGLDGNGVRSLKEVAQATGMSRQGVHYAQDRIIRMIRCWINEEEAQS